MRLRPALVAVAVGILAALAPAAVADAANGSYQVSTCDYANGVNNSWVFQTDDPTHYASHSNCPYRIGGDGGTTDQEGGLSSTDALGASTGAPPGTSAGWTFTAPTGTTITAIDYARYLGQTDDTSNYWVPALLADGTIVPGETCTVVFPDIGCGLGTPPPLSASDTVDITNLSASQLELGEQCQAPAGQICVTGATTEHEVWAAIYGAAVTLSDPTPPTLDTPTGALWGTGPAGGYHQGSEVVTVGAQDVGGGVASITLAVDGQTIATYQATCDYTLPQPCPSSTGPQTMTLQTTQLTNGTHTVTLAADDAAGNESTLASEQITVDNAAPAAPNGLSATPTVAGGSTFDLSWTDPSGEAAPITGATYQLCPAQGGSCAAPASATSPTQATLSVPGPGNWTIAVWLTDAAGNTNPANAAHTTVTVPAASSGGTTGSTAPAGSSGSSDTTGPTTGPTGPTGTGGTSGGKPAKSTVHLSEHLAGRLLRVTVKGSGSEKVTVSYAARWRGRLLARKHKTIKLRHGTASIAFVLSRKIAKRARITVTAHATHQAAATSTLKRATAGPPVRSTLEWWAPWRPREDGDHAELS